MRAESVTIDTGDFMRGLDADMDRFLREMSTAMAQSGNAMAAYARDLAPKDTGHLSRMITHREGAAGLVFYTEVGTNLEYGPYAEYGTGDTAMYARSNVYHGHVAPVTYTAGWPGMRGTPHLRPALYDLYPMFLDNMRAAARRSLS